MKSRMYSNENAHPDVDFGRSCTTVCYQLNCDGLSLCVVFVVDSERDRGGGGYAGSDHHVRHDGDTAHGQAGRQLHPRRHVHAADRRHAYRHRQVQRRDGARSVSPYKTDNVMPALPGLRAGASVNSEPHGDVRKGCIQGRGARGSWPPNGCIIAHN